MKILYVTTGFMPAVDFFGGPVRVVYENSRELMRRGHEVSVLCTNLRNRTERLSENTFHQVVDGIDVTYLKTYNIRRWPGSIGITISPDLFGLLRHKLNDYDIIHIHGYRDFLTLVCGLYAIRLGLPYVLQPHGTVPAILNNIRLKKAFDVLVGHRFLLKRANRVIALTYLERNQLLSLGVSPERAVVIPNGLGKRRELLESNGLRFRRRFGIHFEDKVVLYLGRLHAKKAVDRLIKAFARIRPQDTKLVIVGRDDGERQYLERLVCQLNLESSTLFTGALDGHEVYDAYRAADVFVLPSVVDNFPMSIVEACFCGVPIIVSRTCEIADLINGRAGLVFNGDEESLALALANVLNDRGRREQLSNGAVRIAHEYFSIKTVGNKLEELYIGVLEEVS